MVKCPKCNSEDYTIIDVLDTDMNEETVIHLGEAICDHCGCSFLIESYYIWSEDKFVKEIE